LVCGRPMPTLTNHARNTHLRRGLE
jgi:hypothetical protein